MKILVDDAARAELIAAAEWYAHERRELGGELLEEATRVLDAIAANPTAWPAADHGRRIRRFVFTRFPYVAYFAVRGDTVVVLAFAHASRKPGYWLRRLRP